MLGGGGTVLESGADPPLTRHDGSNGDGIGEQDLSPVCQGHFGLVAADGLDFHGFACELRSV